MDAPRFDVFLSHRSGDKPAVEDLARRLVRRGIEPWLDKWHLIPGERWQDAIEKALSQCASVAVCLGPGGTGPWQGEEMRAAINRRVQDPKVRVIPVLLPGARKDETVPLPEFLTATTWVEFGDTLDDEEEFRRLVCGILGIAPGPGPEGIVQGVTPYRGLQYFDVDDSLFFAGRRILTEDLLGKLRSGNRLLAVLGASGSGKSSLVRAGLLASLKQGRIAGSETWPQAILKPGEKPLERLVDALMKAMPLADDPIELIGKLAEDPRRLHYTVHQALRDAPAETRLVLFVDQFEEVFTGPDEAQGNALVGNLLHASQAEDGRITVLLTLRTDFFGHCSPDLAAALSRHHALVGPMTEDDLRSAIERPAALVGCELEPGLTDLLLEEVEGQPGSLPLLEHALLELWDKKQGRRLTVQAYREIDGVEGALEKHAGSVFESFTAAEQDLCRRIFLRLVQVGEGTAATRRRLALSDLGEKNQPIARRLIDARLLTTDGEESPTVELAHEALITGWERLEEWIKNDRDALLVRRRLDEAVEEWITKGRHASYLYQGGRLAQAEEWAASRPDEVNETTKDFLNASVAQREKENRRLRRLSYGLAAGLLLAVIAAGFAFGQWRESVRQKRVLLAQNLAQKVQSVFTSEPSLGVLLTAEAVRLSERLGEPSGEQEEALRWALSQSRGRALESGRVSGVGTTPDRRFLITAGMDGTARIWDLAAKDPATSGRFLAKLDEGAVSALALTSDRRWLLTRVTEGARARVFLRDLPSKAAPEELPGEDWLGLDSGQPFSPDGRWLVTRQSGKALLRDLKTSTVLPLGIRKLLVMAYSPDSCWLATAFTDGPTELRNLCSADPTARVHVLPDSSREWLLLEFRKGQIVAEHDETVWIWELDPNGSPHLPRRSGGRINHTGMSDINQALMPMWNRVWLGSPGNFRNYDDWVIRQKGAEPPLLLAKSREPEREPVISRYHFRHALAMSDNGRFLLGWLFPEVLLIDLERNVPPPSEITATPLFSKWALSADGSWVARAGQETDHLWNRTSSGFRVVAQADPGSYFYVLALSPDGRWLARGNPQGDVLLWSLQDSWDAGTGGPRELTRHLGGVSTLAFNAEGHVLATGGREGIIRLYDLSRSEPRVESIREPKKGQEGESTALALSPDGRWLAVADASGKVVVGVRGAEERTFENRLGVIQELAFSPDLRTLAAISESGEVQLWKLTGDEKVSKPVLLPQTESVQALAFSSNGRLVTADKDGLVRHWETDLNKLLKIACQAVGRNLTRKEWETHLPGEPYDPRAPCPNLPPES